MISREPSVSFSGPTLASTFTFGPATGCPALTTARKLSGEAYRES